MSLASPSSSSNSAWCDDVGTPAKESCADFKASTLARAVAQLREKLGPDPAAWRWERLHRARFPHGVLDAVGALRPFFSLETGQGGDASTVNVGAYRRDGTFVMSDGPSYRQIVDLADPAKSVFVHATGQSGNVFARGYRDLLPLWRQEFAPIWRAADETEAIVHLHTIGPPIDPRHATTARERASWLGALLTVFQLRMNIVN